VVMSFSMSAPSARTSTAVSGSKDHLKNGMKENCTAIEAWGGACQLNEGNELALISPITSEIRAEKYFP
jgi:hypothetical protein